MEPTQTQLQLLTLRTLLESYDALASASSSLATSTALENAKLAILNAISSALPDLSTVAKAGTPVSGTAPTMVDLGAAVAAIPTTAPATPTNVSDAQTAIIQAMPTIPTDYAKAGNGTNVTNTDIKNVLTDNSTGLSVISGRIGQAPVGSTKSTLFAYLSSIWNSMEGQQQEELPEGLADRVGLLLQFFGIAGSFEAEGVGHEQTDNTVINECKTRYAEVFGDLLPSGFVMPNSVTIDGTTYTGTVS